MDPHKRSATIEVMAADEAILGRGRYGTDRDGYAAMLRYARQWPDRVWAIEGCNGIGRHIANRLLADGEQVLDVPAKLSARARAFATGQGRKTDATDAHSVATVRPRDAVGKARRRVAAELISDLERIYRRTAGRGRRHHPVPQPGALRLLERHGPHRCILRRPDPAPAGASRQPADQPGPAHHGHRPTPQPHRKRAYFDRATVSGKTSMEAMRALKCRLSDVVYRRMLDDALTRSATGSGGHRGATPDSSAAGSHPHAGTSDKPLPGPATTHPTTTLSTAS
nr:transposase [Actinomadura madurae]